MLNKNKINKKKGLVFFIEGFSGSGKSSIGIQSHKKIIKLFGPTIIIHGNEMRDMLELHGFSKSERSKSAYKSRRIIEFIVNQKINVIYAVLCLNYKTKAIYKEKLKNLIEIYIKSDIKTIVENKKKKEIYNLKKNIVGIHIKPQFPKKPNIIIENNFKRSIKTLSNEMVNKLRKLKIN